MTNVPASCHPWLATGAVVYLALALYVSRRGYTRRTPQGTLTARELTIQWARSALSSFEPGLIRLRLHPLTLTLAQIVLGVLAGSAYATGSVFLGGLLLLGCGALDILDGALARRMAQATRRGAFLDSVFDRYTEFFAFCGLAILFENSWALGMVGLAFFGSLMVSYARARAEALGMECPGGLMQRAERFTLLSVSSFLNTVLTHVLCAQSLIVLALGVSVLAVSTNLTALWRIRSVAAALEDR